MGSAWQGVCVYEYECVCVCVCVCVWRGAVNREYPKTPALLWDGAML